MQRTLPGSPSYLVLLGVVIGMFLAGVIVPLASGDRGDEVLATQFGAPQGDGSDGFAGSPGRPIAAGDGGGFGRDTGTDPNPTGGTNSSSGPGGPVDAGGGSGGGLPVGGGGNSAPGPTTGTGKPGSQGLTASDRGVTPETIEVGIMILDLGGLSTVGISVPGTDPEQQMQAWESWIADVNGRGGILGRSLTPFFRKYDLLDADDQRAACLDMKDRKVFVVFDAGGMGDAATLCVTQENQIPMIALGGQGVADVVYQRANGLLFTTFGAGSRSTANFAYELGRRNHLAGKKIGVLSQEGPGAAETLDRGLFAALDALGVEVTHHYHLAADSSTSSSQIPVAVQEMRTRGVDTVFLMTTVLPATQFVQNAEKQAWLPRFWMGDWGGAYSDVYVGNMPASFDGHLITTVRTGEWRVGTPEPPPAVQCRETYERQTGQTLDVSTAEYAFTLRGCTMMKIFVAGAQAAGPVLTRDALSRGIQNLGEVPLATFGGGGFRSGKFDAADLVRQADYDSGCRCWMPIEGFVPGRVR